MILQIQPLSQRDVRWRSERLGTVNGVTIGSDGCVITSMSMVSTYYGHPILPSELNSILTSRNLYYDGDLFVNGSITKIFPDIKFDKVVFCESTAAPITEIKKYLDEGKPIVAALINSGVRHYILVVGYEGDRIFANDPWQGDTIAINDRWGDPARKILQINFFSGPVFSAPVTLPVIPEPQPPVMPPVQPPVAPKPVDAGGDDNGIVIEQPPVVSDIEVKPDSISQLIEDLLKKFSQKVDEDRVNVEKNRQQAKGFLNSLKSRKFILAALSSVVAFINSVFHLGITESQLILFLIPVIAFIIAEGLADVMERARK